MKEALKEAEKAMNLNEIPVGSVIVCNEKIIARGHNQTEMLTDVTAHAEMIAITAANNYLQSKYLDECELYVTLAPCKMCWGAIEHAHIRKVFFGAFDTSHKTDITSLNKLEIIGGILEQECKQLIDHFFEVKRYL